MTSTAAPHLYIDCDLPDGMTLLEWRRNRSAPRRRSLRPRLAFARVPEIRP